MPSEVSSRQPSHTGSHATRVHAEPSAWSAHSSSMIGASSSSGKASPLPSGEIHNTTIASAPIRMIAGCQPCASAVAVAYVSFARRTAPVKAGTTIR